MHLMAPYFDMNLNYSLSYGFVPEDKEYNARAIWAILFNTYGHFFFFGDLL